MWKKCYRVILVLVDLAPPQNLLNIISFAREEEAERKSANPLQLPGDSNEPILPEHTVDAHTCATSEPRGFLGQNIIYEYAEPAGSNVHGERRP